MGQVPSEPFLLPLAVQASPCGCIFILSIKGSSQGGHSLAGDPGCPVVGLVPVGWMGWGVYEHRPMKWSKGPGWAQHVVDWTAWDLPRTPGKKGLKSA